MFRTLLLLEHLQQQPSKNTSDIIINCTSFGVNNKSVNFIPLYFLKLPPFAHRGGSIKQGVGIPPPDLDPQKAFFKSRLPPN
jgi:hypothetical protein